jgi:hypothetical protein
MIILLWNWYERIVGSATTVFGTLGVGLTAGYQSYF